MADILVTSPFQPFTLPTQFKAVFNGYIYCGTVDAVDPSVSQVQVYLVNEDGSKTPVAQPLRTNAGGYLVYNGQPAKFVTASNHSLLVQDAQQGHVWYAPDMASIDPDIIGAIIGAQAYEALRRSYIEDGYPLASGSFESGGTVNAENDTLLFEVEGKGYVWGGALPKIVPPGSSPTSSGGIGAGAWMDVSNVLYPVVSTANNISALHPIGTRLSTLGRYVVGKGPGEYIITAGTSPYPLVDPQIAPDRYAKLLPLRGTNYNYSLLAAGGKNDLTIDSATSEAMNQLLAKIYAESPIVGGLIRAEGGQYYLTETVARPAVGAKHLGIVGDESPITYGYVSKTAFYFDNNLTGSGYAFDFFETQHTLLSDFSLRGEPTLDPTRSGIRLGAGGPPAASGFSNHLIERVQVSNCYDCILNKNSGITTMRDTLVSKFVGRGITLDTCGDSNLYNVYANDGSKDTTELSLGIGVGIYVGNGSNNVNIFGGKLEFNSKGLVVNGSNGVNVVGVQFDYNKMANVIIKSLDDAVQACRSVQLVGCRLLSGGVVDGYQKAGIYLDSTLGSCSLTVSGCSLQAAGDGAYDKSTSGVIGPQVGVYGNGNNTYSIDVTGAGLVMDNPGLTYTAVASGSGTKIKLCGTGVKKPFSELSGGKVHVGFDFEAANPVVLTGTSGSATYNVNSCDTTVIDGMANMDIHINVSGVASLAGVLTITGLPFTNQSSQQASAVMSMTASVANSPNGLYGYVMPGDNKVTLWRRDSTGGVSALLGTDIAAGSLIRMSISMKVC